MKQLRHRGITKKDISNQSTEASYKFQEGHREVRLQFNATQKKSKALTVVLVVVSLASILSLQKHPVKSPIAHTVCGSMVQVGIQYLENEVSPESNSMFQRSFEPVVEGNAQCFVLPFKSRNTSLLSADGCSTELSLRLTKLLGNRAASMSGYFENSLKDAIRNDYLVINGMDLERLKPQQCLNDAVLNFWFKWLITPRSPGDKASRVYISSTYFLSGVLAEGYNSRLQRWLSKVNIFEKQLLIFPVHLGYHWSAVAVFNPGLIKQSQIRWGDETYTGDVTVMFHLDSLGSSTAHNKQQLACAVRDVLNKEWDRHNNKSLDQVSRPFTHRHKSFQMHSPSGKILFVSLYSIIVVSTIYHSDTTFEFQYQYRVTITIAACMYADMSST